VLFCCGGRGNSKYCSTVVGEGKLAGARSSTCVGKGVFAEAGSPTVMGEGTGYAFAVGEGLGSLPANESTASCPAREGLGCQDGGVRQSIVGVFSRFSVLDRSLARPPRGALQKVAAPGQRASLSTGG